MTESLKHNSAKPPAPQPTWIGRSEIPAIEGALEPSAYVARAYLEARDRGGETPAWARKQPNGQWLFDIEYIRNDAQVNLRTIGIGEAAAMLGATRRAVQTWVDQGVIAASGGADHTSGERRRILRTEFMRALPQLKKRLETPAVLGFKRQRSEVHGAGVATKPTRSLQHAESVSTHEATATRKDALNTATAPHEAGGVTTQSPKDEARRAKERAAHTIESMLREARDAKRMEEEQEAQATRIARNLLDAVFSNELTRVDAMLMFTDMAGHQNIPAQVVTRVRKQFFGR